MIRVGRDPRDLPFFASEDNDTESPMKFIVKPTKPEAAGKLITLCWKCSEYPPACNGL